MKGEVDLMPEVTEIFEKFFTPERGFI